MIVDGLFSHIPQYTFKGKVVYYFQNYAYISLDSCSMFISFLIKYLQGSILEISCDVYVY